MDTTMERLDTRREIRPSAWVRALAGIASAAAGLGVGHGIAALTGSASSPLVAVGGAAIDLAPTPVKEFAVATFGTADKAVLIGGMIVVIAILAAVIGLIAWTRRGLALAGIALLGVLGLAAAAGRPGGVERFLPGVATIVVGMLALHLLTRPRGAADDAADPEPTGPAGSIDRAEPEAPSALVRADRRTLLGVAGLGALAVAGGLVGGRTSTPRTPVSLPAPTSPAPPIPAGAQVPVLPPFVTPIPDFYRVDIALVTPRIDPGDWELVIDGMVRNPLRLSYPQLLELPMIERTITLACVSNEVGGPYVGNARWLGVPFSHLIELAGVDPATQQVFSHSRDGGYTCSTPYAAVSDGRDAMVAVGMNGEVLPEKNGFPARMVVPGLFGYVSATKWLARLEFTTWGKPAYWTERGWDEQAAVLTQSRIDVPQSLGTIGGDKRLLAGVAWAQHRGIAKVEVQIDDGPWQEARLADDAGIDQWRQWWFPYHGAPGRHSASVRATDGTGATQPSQRRRVFPGGATGWHTIQFTAQ
ncbi:molybdopterin-dependent oxidoreductase [Enemella evansiae]|uniref:molybdopterin-dependent oxidoreductase n=1 Tax=Enemella evansiae TaxID=2016499 RepID=UPI000B97173A|nr:molybdopterin-dependent oxidoreductase [Enemella evansiae]OYO08294.1 hypothetical protein CGZ98_17275 [Enemella evansiae]